MGYLFLLLFLQGSEDLVPIVLTIETLVHLLLPFLLLYFCIATWCPLNTIND